MIARSASGSCIAPNVYDAENQLTSVTNRNGGSTTLSSFSNSSNMRDEAARRTARTLAQEGTLNR